MGSLKVIHALYTDDDVLLSAVKAVKAEKHHIEEIFTPFPVHGLDKAMGLEPTHLDSHMVCLFQSEEFIEVYLKMGQVYNLPVLVDHQVSEKLLKKYDVKIVLEEILTIMPEEYEKGTEAYYINKIKNLKPGLSTILMHTAFNNDELEAMMKDIPAWGSEWRQKDFDFFMSDTCKELLKEEKIQLVNWRQLKEAFYSN